MAEPTEADRADGHRAIPGPLYWDWRCLVCGSAVDDHPGLLARLRIRRIRRAAEETGQ